MKTITAVILLMFFYASGFTTATADTLRTVVLSGDAALGIPSGVSFGRFRSAVINDLGETAFRAGITGPNIDSSNSIGIWSDGGGTGLTLVAREGDQAPGAPSGLNFSQLSEPILNNAGQTAFEALLAGIDGISSGQRGVWSEGAGAGLELVARSGARAPGTPSGTIFFGFRDLVFNDAGHAAFVGGLSGGDVNVSGTVRGVWSEGGGAGLALVAREGEQVQGLPAGVNYSKLQTLGINSSGRSAFIGDYKTGSGASVTSIFSAGDGAGPTVVAHDGAQAPGTSVGVRFIDMKRINKLSDATINDVGQTAFTMGLTGLGVTDRNNSGIWVGSDSDDLVLVVRDGDPAPGTASGVYFTGFDNLALSAGGKMAFQGVLTDSMYSIWSRDEEGGLTLVAREGDTAPGTTDDAKFLKFRSLAINSAGQVAFSATLSNFSVGRNGIWAKDPSGTLKLIAREGEMLDVDDGPGTDYRTISELSFRPGDTGNQDGRPSGFNNLGQLVFAADFADGSSGVFVHSLVAIPEPSTMLLSGLAAAGLLMLVSKTARSNGS